MPATHHGMSADFPPEMLVTVKFEREGFKTRLTLGHGGVPPGEDLKNARQGWSESFDKLAVALKG